VKITKKNFKKIVQEEIKNVLGEYKKGDDILQLTGEPLFALIGAGDPQNILGRAIDRALADGTEIGAKGKGSKSATIKKVAGGAEIKYAFHITIVDRKKIRALRDDPDPDFLGVMFSVIGQLWMKVVEKRKKVPGYFWRGTRRSIERVQDESGNSHWAVVMTLVLRNKPVAREEERPLGKFQRD